MTGLIGNTVAVEANGILRHATIAMSFKYLCNFGRSLEMPLINYKVELKLKQANHRVLSANDNDNTDADGNDFIFKNTKLYVPFVTYQQKTIKYYQNFLAEDLKDHCIGMNMK